MIENPFVTTRQLPQYISWKHFDALPYRLLLIQPWSHLIQEYGRDGAYMVLPAVALETQTLKVMQVEKSEMVVVSIPLLVFIRAWLNLPQKFRNTFTKDDNLEVSFDKTTQRSITLKDVKVSKPTQQHIAFAHKVYANPTLYLIKKRERRG